MLRAFILISMENRFNSITDTKGLDDLLAQSYNEPVVIFKHSNACPISSAAYEEMEQVDRPIAIIVVQQSRDISNEIERRTGIRHESPQTIIFRNGQAVWSASHWKIKSDGVNRAISQNR
jgi:bacillithiol system protein YtxJ